MRKDLLGLEGMSQEEIIEILDLAASFKLELDGGKKKFNRLNHVSMCNVFFENSTRTRTSFENAAKFLGANAISMAIAQSSVSKGESLLDTIETIEAIKNNIIVIRHSASGVPHMLARRTPAHIINAGDGLHEHPTQALLDMLAMREEFGSLSGLTVAIIGDIKHSRVARSNIYGLTTMGANVKLFAPATMLPEGIDRLVPGIKVCSTVDEAITDCDVVMGLRIQMERQTEGLFPSVAEYYANYAITTERMKLAKPNAVVMHPGPVNRGVEIEYGLVDAVSSRILNQVTCGLAVRMAVITLMAESD